MKTAFMFSGQGSQYAGMGKDLYENHPEIREAYANADKALDFELGKLCFEGGEKLSETEYAQPAIVLHSLVCYDLLTKAGIRPDCCLGLSLGEYSALAAAKLFSFLDTVALVRIRGKLMGECCPPGFGGMSAVLGLSAELCEKACSDASSEGNTALCANYNTDGQIVISGKQETVAEAGKLCLEYGAKRVLPLNVSGPFHTPYLGDASRKFARCLKNMHRASRLYKPVIQVVSNVTAGWHDFSSVGGFIESMRLQMVSPVKWEQSIRFLIAEGYDTFVELGTGNTLCGFVKKIDKNLTILNVEDEKSLVNTVDTLKSKGA